MLPNPIINLTGSKMFNLYLAVGLDKEGFEFADILAASDIDGATTALLKDRGEDLTVDEPVRLYQVTIPDAPGIAEKNLAAEIEPLGTTNDDD
jgi:hypothetical protein